MSKVPRSSTHLQASSLPSCLRFPLHNVIFLLVFFHIWNIKETKKKENKEKGNEWNLFTLRSAHVGPSASTWALIPYVKYLLYLASITCKKGKIFFYTFVTATTKWFSHVSGRFTWHFREAYQNQNFTYWKTIIRQFTSILFYRNQTCNLPPIY